MRTAVNFIFFIVFAFGKEIEETLDAADTISHYGYTVEKHYVTTDDGYTVQLQRIPVGRDDRSILGCSKRPVVFFMHGLFGSSYHFLLNLPSQSAAYIFADAGFDVWLGNIRGTEYGLNHTSFSTNGVNFWNFSLYEHSHYDLRQQIEYVLDYTRHESLFYVGHSQGTAVMFARLAEADVTWQSKIRVFFALGPTAGFMKPLMPFTLLEENYLQALIQFALDGKFGILPVEIPRAIASKFADFCSSKFFTFLCSAGFKVAAGIETLGQVNDSRIPIILSHFPSATSTLNLLHWMQIFKYHELRRLDLGTARNLIAYGQKDAPRLEIGNIIAQTILYFSKDDQITDEVDVREIIMKQMGPGLIESYDLDHFTHFDFILGLRATDEVYKPIVYRIYKELKKKGC
ncbi:Lipase [Caenorhabditis elegans]|uniref:Lipase n=1 Tax=Caenorhabditis elegans TaxID=6239 RepID=Q9U276_CAEEL|nr:Lipase [Caenorhabditis elegans]CAB60584.1 Lipase [Caenorhabditis elegans]|eukprot:NP_506641.1 Lipase [Caenorhabditis elegans]